MTTIPEAVDVQRVLAELLRRPASSLMSLVTDTLPNHPHEYQMKIFWDAKAVVTNTLRSTVADAGEGTPNLVDRLRFAWTVRDESGKRIRSVANAKWPKVIDNEYLRMLFSDVVAVPHIHDALLTQIFECIKIGANGRFVKAYRVTVKSTRPGQLPLAIKDDAGKLNSENLARVVLWLLWKIRYKYVDVSHQSPPVIRFDWLVDELLDSLERWCDPQLPSMPGVNDLVKKTINEWFEYNCLNGRLAPGADRDKREIADAFIRTHRLTKRVPASTRRRLNAAHDATSQQKIQELEQRIAEYADESRKLDDRIRVLESQLAKTADAPSPSHSPFSEADARHYRELTDVLKLIDSKYSFDILNDVQFGNTSPITLQNFLSHLFYVFRKKGVTTYPDEDRFTLTYEQSGLYTCIDFQVLPGELRDVEVLAKGWALRLKERLLPIRFAQVALASKSS